MPAEKRTYQARATRPAAGAVIGAHFTPYAT
jgi:hypothetical protein